MQVTSAFLQTQQRQEGDFEPLDRFVHQTLLLLVMHPLLLEGNQGETEPPAQAQKLIRLKSGRSMLCLGLSLPLGWHGAASRLEISEVDPSAFEDLCKVRLLRL